MTRHSDQVYLRHMLDHAREAATLLGSKSVEELEGTRVLQLALLHLVEIIGEAASRVTPETRAALPSVPWRGAVSMRNRIIHGYDTVNVRTLWDTISEDLPRLIAGLEAILSLGNEPSSGNTA